MSKVRWRALSVLVTVAAIILAMSFQAWSQICRCDQGACSSRAPMRSSESSFTIPLGLIAAALQALLKVPLPRAAIVIPDIKITLSRSLMGDAYVSCPPSCCFGRLGVEVLLLLEGEASLGYGPPIPPIKVTTRTRVKSVKDNDSKDRNKEACLVETDFELSQGGVSVSLIFPGGITVPLYGEAEGTVKGTVGAYAEVYCGCRVGYAHSYLNHLPNLSVPKEVIMSVYEREAEFQFRAEDPDLDPLWIEAELLGVSGEVSVSQDGQGKITLSPGAQIDERTEASVSIKVYDLKQGEVVAGSPRPGQYYHSVFGTVSLRFKDNHRPQACDIDGTIYVGYLGQFSCVVQDPDGDILWGPLWLISLPEFCKSLGIYLPPMGLYILVDCYLDPRSSRFVKEGDYKASYVVWDDWDDFLQATGTVVIHVLKNEPPEVKK